MQKLQETILQVAGPIILTMLIPSVVKAEEKIIQQEEISFEKCLTVIQTSQDKLSIAPKIIDESDENV